MSFDEQMMAEIQEANLSYLILAQRMIRLDRVQALFRLGIPDEIASIVDALTPSQMIRIAAGNSLVCRFRFDEQMIWSLLAEHGTSRAVGEAGSASRLHASILMAGRFAEAV